MQRDGARKSLWQAGSRIYSAKNTAVSTEVFDVIIAGGGMTGIVTGLLLQQKGLKVLIAEAKNLCFGTTSGTTAHLNTIMDTTYDQVESDFGNDGSRLLHAATREALDLVQKHVAEFAIQCGYAEKDGYLYAQTEKQVETLEKIYRASVRAHAEVEYAEKIPVPIAYQKALVFHRQAQFHPTDYALALAQAFEARGGTIMQGCHIDAYESHEDHMHFATNMGFFTGKRLVWATHIPPGINLLHFRCAPYRSYAMAVTLEDNAYPDGLAYDMYDPYHYYRTQEADGQRYLIAGGEDHKTAHETNTEACFQQLEAHLRHHFKIKEVAYKWSSQYFEPADGLAYIGHLPGNPENVYVATGFGGNGMTYSHIAAITLTELITTGDSRYAKLFSPSRVKPVAGFMDFIKENADVVKEFVGKRIGTKKIDGLAELAPGEGRVVKYDGKKIAMYKDEGGKLYALSPVCTHAKCIVDWNNAEKTWDCPCHGARYSVTGDVLTGPASKGLEQIDLTEE